MTKKKRKKRSTRAGRDRFTQRNFPSGESLQKRRNPYKRVTQEEAIKRCGPPLNRKITECPRCGTKVVLHCDACKLQITNCMCGLREQVDEADVARVKLEDKGFIVPGDN